MRTLPDSIGELATLEEVGVVAIIFLFLYMCVLVMCVCMYDACFISSVEMSRSKLTSASVL